MAISTNGPCILTINAGSSSLKAAAWRACEPGPPLLRATAAPIGEPGSRARLAAGSTVDDASHDFPDHASATRWLLEQVAAKLGAGAVVAVGHRIVHGGAEFTAPVRITPEVLAALERLADIDPDHAPAALGAVRAAASAIPHALQAACFDTAFHATMDGAAIRLPLPRRLHDAGIRRYGFHGLSCASIVRQLRAEDPAAAAGRTVIAHLGSGASVTAIRDGCSVDTSMGFSPAGGMMMSTRTGDLDPGVLLRLMRDPDCDAAAVDGMVNREGGLLGVSGTTGDMARLLALEHADPRAAEAVEMFCRSARRWIAAMAATLGGIDTLVFTAGIGENCPAVRARICTGLEFAGVTLHQALNDAGAAVISAPGSGVIVRVMQTDEDAEIAAGVRGLLDEGKLIDG